MSPSEKNIIDAVADFCFSSQRRNYTYRFGLAIPIDVVKNQLLMAGIIIDSAITFRAYVEDSNGMHISVSNLISKYRHIQEALEDKAFPDILGWPKDYYIYVKRPEGIISRWNFAEMKDEALDNLSNMNNCIHILLEEYNSFIADVKLML